MLKFYMGKNTPERQEFIIDNLRVEHDMAEDEGEAEEKPKDNVKTIATADKEKAIA